MAAPSKTRRKAPAPALKFEPAVFTGSVLFTTDEAVLVQTETGMLLLPRKPGPTRFARGDELEFQFRITKRAAVCTYRDPAQV